MAVDTKKIESILKDSKEPSERELALILKDASLLKGLPLEAVASLLSIKDAVLLEKLYNGANEVKRKVFGNRIVFFAPLYLSNHCANQCLYCGFRGSNDTLPRKALSEEELIREARTLEAAGFKRILLVTGESPRYGADYIINSVKTIYKNTGVRIVHVNTPPMTAQEYAELKAAGAGVYQLFQETYHRPTYAVMHPGGAKKVYDYRISAIERALQAGFEDVGIGALLGLYDHRFDCLCVVAHSFYLYGKYGAHAHTVSAPRLRPASGSILDTDDKYGSYRRFRVTDGEFKKIVSTYRLALPSSGVVVSTREPAQIRNEVIRAGASQMSASSRTDPGGYSGASTTLEQFSTLDRRTLLEAMADVIRMSGMPSLCTTCYRTGRTGPQFTEVASAGGMRGLCGVNAILTLKEYVLEKNPNGLSELFNGAITKATEDLEPALKKKVEEKLRELEEGKQDLYF
jgi:2-iminoacetate synthase